MMNLAQGNDRGEGARFNPLVRFAVIISVVAVLSGAAYAMLVFSSATTGGLLAWRLALSAVGGSLIAFAAGSYFSGRNANADPALMVLMIALLLLVTTLVTLLSVTVWPNSIGMLHQYTQWFFVGLQSLYLVFVLQG